jgi:exo-1,4-beta-D-glucosaminidase
MKKRLTYVFSMAALCFPVDGQSARNDEHARIDLAKNWRIQSSAKVMAKGDAISTPKFQAENWYPATIPSTVVAALVDNKVHGDPYFGMNLRSFPGMSYAIGENFSNGAMPDDSPFKPAWWYRTEFKLPPSANGKTIWLNFEAINYRANIWLNGHQVADSDEAVGMYRMFEFDVTSLAVHGGANVLAVEVFPPTENDLTITFVDWNPMPPDKAMGLVRDVYILTSGPVALRNTQVITHLDSLPEKAHLSIATDLRNSTGREITGTLKASIGNIVLSKRVKIAPQDSTRVSFASADYPQLNIDHPKLWWPYPLGPQNLQQLRMEFESGGKVSDRQEVQFGIREITSELDAQKHRLFKINGKNILIRGGGWTPDLLLRSSPERDEQEILYARDMHLNTIRLEGKMMNDHFYESCDRHGVMVIAGWCCCSYWERWKEWKPEDYTLAGNSLRDQIRRIRNHPSVLAWLYGSDESPAGQAESVYLKTLQEEQWPNPYVSSAADRTTEGAGPTGVKMSGPYEYVAPNYWLLDQQHGGAFGFNTETSPGPAIPHIESLRQMLPKEHLWPMDEFWEYHAGGGQFKDVKVFTAALEGRYGKAETLEDYLRKSQVMTYEAERAMFEAYGRNKYTSTGVVQWMLNNAWPSLIWHLYDYYLRPGGGYFGTKKANEPLHVQYSYDDQSVVVVNSYYQAFSGYKVSAKVYNLDLTEKFSQTATLDVGPDSSTRVLVIPQVDGLSKVYFVRLQLEDSTGKQVSSNFYWLSTQPDVSDFAASQWYVTPIKTYADLTGLQNLPEVKLKLSSRPEQKSDDEIDHVTVENPTTGLAFSIHLQVLKAKDGADVQPVIWEDNYFELMPGEKREVTASYKRKLLGGSRSHIKVDGWNVPAISE